MKPIKDKFLLPFLLPMCLFSTAIGESFDRTNIQSSTSYTPTQLQKYTSQAINQNQSLNKVLFHNTIVRPYDTYEYEIEAMTLNNDSHRHDSIYFSLSLLGLVALFFCFQKQSHHINRFFNIFRLTLLELSQTAFSFLRLKRHNQNLWGYANIHIAQFYPLTLLHP